MNKKYTTRIESLKNSRFGKFVRRVMGEESGQAMMEYVILATMIAAAVAFSAWLFGSQIRAGFVAMSHAITGNHVQTAEIVRLNQELANVKAQLGGINGGKYTDSCGGKAVEAIGTGTVGK